MKLLVSACLMGLYTRYDGGHNTRPDVLQLLEEHTLIPVCPEQLGGLPTPRPPCEIQGRQVLRQDGLDCTAAFLAGAQAAVKILRLTGCQAAILKSRSPSCGKGPVYDGSFTGTLVPGQGILAGMLRELSIPVYDETEVHLIR